jgi:ADP-dependent NAD(P)H-hydrate dehydratase / NAD(P)H-hydrate epimerase
MRPVLTAAETRELDRATEARGTSVETLMERAGQAVARAALDLAGGGYGRRAVVLCGKGNNGGDGLVAARHLARRGMAVDAFLLAEPSSLRPPASTMVDRLRDAGVTSRPFEVERARRALERAEVAVDAIFGIGFRGPAEGPHREAIQALDAGGTAVVAVDLPSGVEGDTGVVRGEAVHADVTVTFGAPKVGAVLYPGAGHVGLLEVADIGFPTDLLDSELVLTEADDVRSLLPNRGVDAHKRGSGVVLIVAGSRRMTGAPRLIAEGAYRAGVGLVTVAVPEGILPVVQAGITEATFLPLAEGPSGSVAEDAWVELAGRLPSFDAVAVGPGLSTDDSTPGFVRRLLRESPVPAAVDADAINAFAGRAGELADRQGPSVITPHTGEFARLFGMPDREVAEDRVGLVRKAAAETGCVVLLKGPRTLVARPEGRVSVNPTGSPALATGGTGDVLTGVVAALLARGLSPADAATAGAFVHGLAGELAGRETGEGTMAGDVARNVPRAVRLIREGG